MQVIVKAHEFNPPVIPTYITRVLVYGSGWNFQGRADNIEFVLTPKMINRNDNDNEDFYCNR
jgi:hypothetical protein